MFWKKKNTLLNDDREKAFDEDPSFEKTFKICSFGMRSVEIYPSDIPLKKLLFRLSIVLLTFVPILFSTIFDMFLCLKYSEIDDLVRQIAMGIPFSICMFKMALATYYRKKLLVFLREISKDLKNYKYMDEYYQMTIKEGLAGSKKAEITWVIMATVVVGSFPLIATVQNIRYYGEQQFLPHEVRVPWMQDIQNNTPYFEIINIYMFFIGFLVQMNFTGFDGCFCVVVNQASLKIKLFSLKMKLALEKAATSEEARKAIKESVIEHCEIINYMNDLQEVYGPWLGSIFVATIAQICLTLYQITLSEQMDIKFAAFFFGAILHIFIPCHFCSKLTYTSQELSTEMYLTEWLKVNDMWVIDAVKFMIARSQSPFFLTGAGMVIFDMNLFVSVMQSSYSLYTLLSASK